MAKPFTVVEPTTVRTGQQTLQPSSKDRHALQQINPDDVVEGDGKTVSAADIQRLLKLVQDNIGDATKPCRTNPLNLGELHRNIGAKSGKNVQIKHGLGEAFGGWSVKRVYPGSNVPAFIEADKNGGLDPAQYLVLAAGCNGTYDFEINPK